jgi:Zn-dependent M16 (insulinase) family peptidase
MNDSGLGAAVIGGGIDDELKQPIFGLGLKGVDPANIEKVRFIVKKFWTLLTLRK